MDGKSSWKFSSMSAKESYVYTSSLTFAYRRPHKKVRYNLTDSKNSKRQKGSHRLFMLNLVILKTKKEPKFEKKKLEN